MFGWLFSERGKAGKGVPAKLWRWEMAALLLVLRNLEGEILVCRAIFSVLGYPRH